MTPSQNQRLTPSRSVDRGLVVPPGDRGAQAEALKRLAFDEPLHRRKGNAAGRRAEDFPTWGDTARMLFTELRSALA
jgi:glycosyltransferase involved in cell wall biosynthesis